MGSGDIRAVEPPMLSASRPQEAQWQQRMLTSTYPQTPAVPVESELSRLTFRAAFRRPQVIILAIALACSDPHAPYELPAPDPSLDPGALRIGAVYYRCGQWRVTPPPEDHVLVDVFFGRRNEQDPPDRPLDDHLSAAEAHGAFVLFQFDFPAIRAWIQTDSIPSLSDRGYFVSVHEVPDPRRYDWLAGVGYDHAVAPGDEARITELGGLIRRRFEALNQLEVQLPNRSFAELRATSGVLFVEASSQIC